MASVQAPLILLSLMIIHGNLRLECARKYTELATSYVYGLDRVILSKELRVGQMDGSISEMSVINVYNINKRMWVSCYGPVSLGKDILAELGYLNE